MNSSASLRASLRSATRGLHLAVASSSSSSAAAAAPFASTSTSTSTCFVSTSAAPRHRLISTLTGASASSSCRAASFRTATSRSNLPPTSTRWASSSSSSSSSNSNSGSPPRPDLRAALSASQRAAYSQRNRSLFMYTGAVIIIGVGVTYAAVPLYRAFCSATGFSGTPVLATLGEGKFDPTRLIPAWLDPRTGAETRRIRVTFNADSTDALPWSFEPSQKEIFVLPGETALAFYKARNDGPKDITGIATYNVAPDRVAPYFAKVECFCFEEQKLLAGEEVDLPVFFFIDRDVLDDPSVKDVKDVVLSYTFFGARRNKQGHLEPDTDLEAYRVGIDLPGVK